MTEAPVYKKKDFVSDQDVKWCPGCGDYAILSALQMTMTKIGKKKEDIVFVSGIGCSSRFPYYMSTYGLHTIHGRAPAVASGLKLKNKNLSVWLITGDGDSMAIGGNHLIHAIRRNININMIMFNNEIYGLTKGQYSPTSKIGTVTKSSPYGSLDRTFIPAKLCLGAGATFYARTIDTDLKHMQQMFLEAEKHEGLAFVEVLQNCVIFNDKVHDNYTNRKEKADFTFVLEHGKPMIFGKEKNKGIILKDMNLDVVTIGENGVTEKDILIHDETNTNLSSMIANLIPHQDPMALGVVRRVLDHNYDSELHDQIDKVTEKKGKHSMKDILLSGNTWEVK